MDPIGSAQNEDIAIAVDNMVQQAVANGFPDEHLLELKYIVSENMDIFGTSFFWLLPILLH